MVVTGTVLLAWQLDLRISLQCTALHSPLLVAVMNLQQSGMTRTVLLSGWRLLLVSDYQVVFGYAHCTISTTGSASSQGWKSSSTKHFLVQLQFLFYPISFLRQQRHSRQQPAQRTRSLTARKASLSSKTARRTPKPSAKSDRRLSQSQPLSHGRSNQERHLAPSKLPTTENSTQLTPQTKILFSHPHRSIFRSSVDPPHVQRHDVEMTNQVAR